ncbi:MAG: regulatory protein RecX [Clostridia bacterium]|nr:regulatory protein RecX [Clostridia bacterium]
MDRVLEIKRRGGVATVKMESGEVLRAPSALYLERRLHTGQQIDPDAYRLYLRERGYPHALEAAMKFLALRERSEQEVRARLRRSCYDEQTIARVLDTLGMHDLVSDARFAEAWVHARSRKYGKNRIAQELRIKGVDRQEAETALDTLTEEDEYRRAVEQAKKLCRKFQNDPKKIAQSLTRKGYHWKMAKDAAEEAVRDASL